MSVFTRSGARWVAKRDGEPVPKTAGAGVALFRCWWGCGRTDVPVNPKWCGDCTARWLKGVA
jgi:hypothetical protein